MPFTAQALVLLDSTPTRMVFLMNGKKPTV